MGRCAHGGIMPYTFTADGLPEGLELSADGKLTGVPAVDGEFAVGITVKDSTGEEASRTVYFRIKDAEIELIIDPDIVHGTVTAEPENAKPGDKVQLTAV